MLVSRSLCILKAVAGCVGFMVVRHEWAGDCSVICCSDLASDLGCSVLAKHLLRDMSEWHVGFIILSSNSVRYCPFLV